MKAAVLYGPGDVRIEDVEIPELGINDVLIKVMACGVCGTDYALFKGDYPGNYPVIIGHEFAGQVIRIGSEVTKFKPGDRVTVDPNTVCHKCFYCQSGSEHLCSDLKSMGVHQHGAVAEYCKIGESNIYKIPDNLLYTEAAFTEPLACAIHGNDIAQVKIGDTVLIIGAGGMGNLITQVAKYSGAANIIVSEPIEHRRELALENGATHVVDPNSEDIESEIRKLSKVGADVVFEVAGNNSTQALSVSLSKKGGTIVFFGCSPQNNMIEINPFLLNENEIKISGSFNNKFATARAVQMLSSGVIRVDNLISHNFQLKDYLTVFNKFGASDTMKLMVLFE